MSEIDQLLNDNTMLVNIGGHYFQGLERHDRKVIPLLQMSDLEPLEQSGRVTRRYKFSEGGKRYVGAFIVNKHNQ